MVVTVLKADGSSNLSGCKAPFEVSSSVAFCPLPNSSGDNVAYRVSSEGGFVAKRLEPQSGSVRFLHSFPRIGKADSEETDQPPLPMYFYTILLSVRNDRTSLVSAKSYGYFPSALSAFILAPNCTKAFTVSIFPI